MSKLPQAAPIPDKPPLHIKGGNLVVVAPESITEACFSVPAVRALRNSRPTAKLAVLAPETHLPVWQSVEGIDLLLPYPEGASSRKILPLVRDCDLTLETSFMWEDSSAARAVAKARVGQRLGYDLKPLNKRLTDKLPLATRPGPVEHRVRFYLGLLDKLGIDCYRPQNFQTPPLPSRPQRTRIALAPGSTSGAAYQWDLDRFRQLGEALLDDHQVELVLLAFPGHAGEANELDQRLNGRARNYGNEFDLAGLLSALPHCNLLVANDGATVHLAAHLGVPAVALFGPGDPVAARPLGRQHLVLSQFVECSPCNRTPCPLRHHRCMQELTVERVLAAVTALLQPQEQPQAT